VDTSAALHHFLATGYLRSRKFREALQHEEKALALARGQGDAELIKTLEQQVALRKRLLQASNGIADFRFQIADWTGEF